MTKTHNHTLGKCNNCHTLTWFPVDAASEKIINKEEERRCLTNRENSIKSTSAGFQGDNVGDHMTRSFGQWHEVSIYKHQLQSRRVQTAIRVHLLHRMYLSGGGSHGLCPTEQRGHLLIRHGLLVSRAHGLTQVDSQDVLALRDKSKNTDEILKNRLKLPETQNSEFLQKFNQIATQRALFLSVEMFQHFLIYYVL